MRKVLILVSVSLFAGLVFVSQSDVAQAHYCDDHYANQAARENCWWRYENDRATAADARLAALSLPETPAAEANGFFCDTHYPLQANKENCWWRYHNHQLLPHEQQAMSSPPAADPPMMMEEMPAADPPMMMEEMPAADPPMMMEEMPAADPAMMDKEEADILLNRSWVPTYVANHLTMAPEDMAKASGAYYCDFLFSTQANREACWWHLNNDEDIGFSDLYAEPHFGVYYHDGELNIRHTSDALLPKEVGNTYATIFVDGQMYLVDEIVYRENMPTGYTGPQPHDLIVLIHVPRPIDPSIEAVVIPHVCVQPFQATLPGGWACYVVDFFNYPTS